MRRLLSACCVFACAAQLGAEGREHGLMIRVYNSFEVSRHELTTALRFAAAIFRDAGLDTTWRECRTPKGPSSHSPDRCQDVPAPEDLIVRVIAGPLTQQRTAVPLGFSFIDRQTSSGVLSTIYADRLFATAARVAVDRADLLAVSMAHEVGHLLLGTVTHTGAGLMAAYWPDASLRHDAARSWRFSPHQAALMGAMPTLNANNDNKVGPTVAVGTLAAVVPSLGKAR